MTATAPEEVRKRVEADVEELRQETLKYLDERGGRAALREVLQELRTRHSQVADELVSRALTGMLSSDVLGLASDRTIWIRQ